MLKHGGKFSWVSPEAERALLALDAYAALKLNGPDSFSTPTGQYLAGVRKEVTIRTYDAITGKVVDTQHVNVTVASTMKVDASVRLDAATAARFVKLGGDVVFMVVFAYHPRTGPYCRFDEHIDPKTERPLPFRSSRSAVMRSATEEIRRRVGQGALDRDIERMFDGAYKQLVVEMAKSM